MRQRRTIYEALHTIYETLRTIYETLRTYYHPTEQPGLFVSRMIEAITATGAAAAAAFISTLFFPF